MQSAAGNGGLIMMHAENGSAIDVLVQQALERGDVNPYFHGTTRPWQAEAEATPEPSPCRRDGAGAAHVAAERLTNGELEAADGAAVHLGLGRLGAVRETRFLVAGPVPA
jgi:dihydroorotase-like cyclic amidohydrolase